MRGAILPEADKLGRDIGVRIGDPAGREARKRIELQLKDLKAKVNVDADTAKAQAQVAALKSKVDGLNKSKGPSALLTAVVGLGPALVPLAGIAAASFGAVATGAGVAVLAVKGIEAEMKSGSKLGQAYSADLGLLKSDFGGLEQIAARGVFSGVNKSIADIHSLMPGLSTETRLFSGYLGDAGEHVVHGLAGGFVTLQPLIGDILKGATGLAAKFDSYANGGGLQKFGEWAQKNLPAVAHDVGQIAEAVARLLASGAGTGVGVLNALGAIATAINHIPLPVLQVLLPLISATLVAWKGYAIVKGILDSNTAAIIRQTFANRALAVSAEQAAVAGKVKFGPGRATPTIPTAGKAAGGGGLAAGAGSIFGPIALGAAGIKVISNVIGHKPTFALGDTKTSLNFKVPKSQASANSDAEKAATAAQAALAAAYEQTATSAFTARAAEAKTLLQLQLSGDAAGVLAAQLAKLDARYVDTGSATDAFYEALNQSTATLKTNMGAIAGHSAAALADRDAIRSAHAAAEADSVARAKATNSQAAGILVLQRARDAQIHNTDATLKAAGATDAQIAKVNRFIRATYRIPKSVPTVPILKSAAAQRNLDRYVKSLGSVAEFKNTTFNAKTGQAVTKLGNLQKIYDSITNKTVTITLNARGSARSGQLGTGFGIATGGHVSGPGTGTSDSIPAWLSNGEFVINAAQTAKHRSLLDSINRGAQGFASGGPVASRTASTFRVSDGSALGVVSGLSRSTPIIAAAVRNLSRAVVDAVDLKGAQGKLAATRTALQNLLGKASDLASATRSNFGVDPSTAGATDSVGYVPGVSNVIKSYQSQAAAAKKFRAQLSAAKHKGLSDDLLAQFAAAGPSRSFDLIAGGSKAQIGQLNAAERSLVHQRGLTGQYASSAVYGADIRAERASIVRQTHNVDKLVHEIRALTTRVDKLAGKDTVVSLDGKVIARAAHKADAQAARR